MCGRFVMISNVDEIVEQYGVVRVASRARRSYNIAPGSDVVVVTEERGERALVDMRWGFPMIGSRTNRLLINARSETADRKPSFREAFRKQRCLVMADGYYEWESRGKSRVPWYVHFVSRGPVGLGGLFRFIPVPGGGVRPACVIMTTAANECTRPIHDRMPVILTGEDAGLWLDGTGDQELVKNLLCPRDFSDMEAYQVATLVNSPGNDVPDCIEPVAR
ncbi:MAG TPA: SOS response-associated peptidase [Deltaproteobacteria bacterium]|nr:SOS response-associated peptidase [Deltaproteobacteria bacterium]